MPDFPRASSAAPDCGIRTPQCNSGSTQPTQTLGQRGERDRSFCTNERRSRCFQSFLTKRVPASPFPSRRFATPRTLLSLHVCPVLLTRSESSLYGDNAIRFAGHARTPPAAPEEGLLCPQKRRAEACRRMPLWVGSYGCLGLLSRAAFPAGEGQPRSFCSPGSRVAAVIHSDSWLGLSTTRSKGGACIQPIFASILVSSSRRKRRTAARALGFLWNAPGGGFPG